MIETLLSSKPGGGSGNPPIGQKVFEASKASVHYFEVPPNVYELCGVIVSTATSNYAGGGGGLSWRNNIPVTPGERLTIIFGTKARAASVVRRGNETLLISYCPDDRYGGLGGKNASSINDGGGNGGDAGNASGSSTNGGAGGYMGNGGKGAPVANRNGSNGSGGGGGGGGRASVYGSGGGVSLMGQGADGVGGRATAGQEVGGRGSEGNGTIKNHLYGGAHFSTGYGGCRLIWGEGRAYPKTNTADM